jgi:hypothetical protein
MISMSSVYARAVRKAAELAGGNAELARVLQVPRDAIEKWIVGEGMPPRDIFLRVVDIVIDGAAAAE